MKTIENSSAPCIWLEDQTLNLQFQDPKGGPHTVQIKIGAEPHQRLGALKVLEDTLRAWAPTKLIAMPGVPTQHNVAKAMADAIALGKFQLVGRKRLAPEDLSLEDLKI